MIKLKIILFFILITGFFLFGFQATQAAGYEIEVSIPGEGGLQSGDEAELGPYIAGLYNFLLGLVVLVALGALVYAGFQYMLGGTVSSVEDAKKWLWSAIGGLILALSAFLILQTINPELVGINPPGIGDVEPPDATCADPATCTEAGCAPGGSCGSGTWDSGSCSCKDQLIQRNGCPDPDTGACEAHCIISNCSGDYVWQLASCGCVYTP